MSDLLRPDLLLDSVYDLDWDKLRRRGIRARILDLDNTLVGWRSMEVPTRLREWFREMSREGFRACLVSNNMPDRVDGFAARLEIPGISRATKPRRGAFRRAMSVLGVSPEETAVVGDQVFTDILGGNRLGLFTVLVVPVTRTEFIGTRAVRILERWVLSRLARGES